MSEIRIMKKPDWVSWDNVQECQRKAHEVNRKKGVDMNCSHLTGEQLKKDVGDGICFVALDGKTVVGTCSYKNSSIKRWWCKGNSAYLCMDAVIPEYQGLKIYSQLCEVRNESIEKDARATTIWINTAEKNTKLQQIYLKNGYQRVQFSYTGPEALYYSVILAKWPKMTTVERSYLRLMYWLSKLVIKTIWKPGKRLRFSIG
ncbi:MAG: GNAT family N-acetyltransferase [Bacteroidaceae bacterium]|nr:GNAT family N-acetyltransferase [Bacteroidaceae bacterium]